MSNRESILLFLGISILVLSTFVTNHIIYIILSIIGIYIGISQFLIDKREKDTVISYCRKDKPLWKIFLLMLVFFSMVYLIPMTAIDAIFDNVMSYYALFIFIGSFFASVHQNFIHSIRAYPKGLKMPGRRSGVIPWEDVNEMKMIDESLKIQSQQISDTILIDRRDLKYLPGIVEAWEKSRQN